ncbi:MAG: histone deacetylase [Anaerolineales bacterium]|nr:histone deacetylase [Anaerolineales bacterium]
MDSMALYYPDGHQKHYLYAHPESPERVEVIKKGLIEIGLWENCPQVSPLELDLNLLESVHDREYLKILERASRQAKMLDPDTFTTPESWQLALNAAGGGVQIADLVWERKAGTGFALTRPPGHHATRNRGMGFCLINNIAVAAEYLLQVKGAERIAILDLDLHHGNGTQDIFWDRPDVCYISIHQAPFYPGTGALYETGSGPGEGTTLNLPIPRLSGDIAYMTLISDIVLPYLEDQKVDMLLISFGFDTHWKDPLGSMQVSAGCIYEIMKDLKNWVEDNCSGRLAIFLEGGYDLEAGRACGQAVGAALCNKEWEDSLGISPTGETDDWRETLSEAHNLFEY